MPDVKLSQFNTVTLLANTVYRLVTGAPTAYSYSVINLGPGILYLRADADPGINDPYSETLPALTADNQIPVANGIRGLGVLADQAGAISVRLGSK